MVRVWELVEEHSHGHIFLLHHPMVGENETRSGSGLLRVKEGSGGGVRLKIAQLTQLIVVGGRGGEHAWDFSEEAPSLEPSPTLALWTQPDPVSLAARSQ